MRFELMTFLSRWSDTVSKDQLNQNFKLIIGALRLILYSITLVYLIWNNLHQDL